MRAGVSQSHVGVSSDVEEPPPNMFAIRAETHVCIHVILSCSHMYKKTMFNICLHLHMSMHTCTFTCSNMIQTNPETGLGFLCLIYEETKQMDLCFYCLVSVV